MYAKFRVGYPELTQDELDRIRPWVEDAPATPEHTTYREWHGQLDEVVKLFPGHTLEVTGMTPATGFITLCQKIDQLAARISVSNPTQEFNNRVNVHIPGLGLLAITEVEVLKDACTAELQRELEKGWRILAICPQPDQRRPDYIIGKTSREHE